MLEQADPAPPAALADDTSTAGLGEAPPASCAAEAAAAGGLEARGLEADGMYAEGTSAEELQAEGAAATAARADCRREARFCVFGCLAACPLRGAAAIVGRTPADRPSASRLAFKALRC